MRQARRRLRYKAQISGLLVLMASINIMAFSLPITQGAARFTSERAVPAATFINSICVATHWSYPDTPYGANYAGVRQMLVASGIRHVRDGAGRAQDLGQAGIMSIYVADIPSNADSDGRVIQQIHDILATSLASGAAYDAVEGPNEPDLFWPNNHKTYKGQGFPAGPIAFQRDLYHAIKSDPATAGLIVIGPSLGTTLSYSGNPLGGTGALADAVDWGNFHPYPGGNPFNNPVPYDTMAKYFWQSDQPSVNLDEHPFAFDNYAPPFSPKPMAATETGYSTFTGSIPEALHAKYMPRLFLEYFRTGVVRTCSYEFVDEFTDPSNREANFGLIRHDLSPKPAYTAIKNMIGTLQDSGASFTPNSLDYALTVTPAPGYDRTQYVHHLLMQKRDGTFYLALWHEIGGEDTSTTPPRQITIPLMPTTITFGQPMPGVTIYAPNDGATPTGAYSADGAATYSNATSITLNVPDKVLLIKLSPNAVTGITPTATKATTPTVSATATSTPTGGVTNSNAPAGKGVVAHDSANTTPFIILAVVLNGLLLGGLGFFLWRRRFAQRPAIERDYLEQDWPYDD